MKVLSVTSECYPLVKTGGLADVAGALPIALAGEGVDSRVLMPAYPGVREQLLHTRRIARLPALFGGPGALLSGTTVDGLDVWLLDAPHLFTREGGPYIGPDGRDWPDNHVRFAALSWAGAQAAVEGVNNWKPDLVHLHDWQTALTAAYLRFGPQPSPPSLLTIHNLAFQGVFGPDVAASLRLPADAMSPDGIEYWGSLSFLKAGVVWSTWLNTVSPTYAREILDSEHGMGFDGLLRTRAHELSGIVNGIDDGVWNPATDPHIPHHYSSRRLPAKAANKAALQRELGLDEHPHAPLVCVVSRLSWQKGLDLLLGALPRLLARGGQLALLGSGDADLEAGFRHAAAAHPGQVATVVGYDEPLAHRLQAGADAVLMPSRFEPCGLSQLYGLRYGTLPVVARVGGLADTVIDANEAALRDGVATGFQFSPVDVGPLAVAFDRVCDLFADQAAWQRVQRRAMSRDVGWDLAARAYLALYRRMLDDRSSVSAADDPVAASR